MRLFYSKSDRTIFIIGFFSIIIVTLIGALISSQSYESNPNCVKLDLFNTAYCLNEHASEFYKYNLTNVYTNLSEEELKVVGGVCWHWAGYYVRKAKDLGFYAKEVTLELTEETGHMFALMSNEHGYCILDEDIVNCWKVKP